MSKKVLLRGAIGLVVLIVLVVAGSLLFLPRQVTVSRSIDVDASPAVVFPLISDLRRFNEWSPWYDRDPEATYTFTGPTEGVGQTFHWESEVEAVGSGTMTVEAIEPETAVTIGLAFDSQGAASSSFLLEPKGAAASTVTWGFETDLGYNPIARFFGGSIVDAVGADYEQGLARLKQLAETPPEPTEDE